MGQTDLTSGEIVAGAKIAHEFGHVEESSKIDASTFLRRGILIGVWNLNFFSGQKELNGWIEEELGGNPDQVSRRSEHAAEAYVIPYLQEAYGKKAPKAVRQAIENFQKGTPNQ